MNGKQLASATCIALLLLALRGPEAAAGQSTRVFAGKLVQFLPEKHRLVMDSPGSRRYPHPTIHWDTHTKWAGLAATRHAAKPGDPVRIDVVEEADGSFRAVKINLLEPEGPPVKTGALPPK